MRFVRDKDALKENTHEAGVKATEAANAAVGACRLEAPVGAVCYLCLRDKALVHSCACRGTAGFAHVGCLAKLGKSQKCPSEANPNDQNFVVWMTCQLCFQNHMGVVLLALARQLWSPSWVAVPRPNTLTARAAPVHGRVRHHHTRVATRRRRLAELHPHHYLCVSRVNTFLKPNRASKEAPSLKPRADDNPPGAGLQCTTLFYYLWTYAPGCSRGVRIFLRTVRDSAKDAGWKPVSELTVQTEVGA